MKLTVFFEGPFWVGVLEWMQEGRLKATRYVFGAEPRDPEVLEFVQREMLAVMERVGSGVVVEWLPQRRVNPKRMIRETQKQLAARGITSKAEAALKQELELCKKERRVASREQREQLAARKRAIAREKAKAKHRGR